MTRKYVKRKFDEEGLDALYRSDPERRWTLAEIADAADVPRQTVKLIEKRALKKLREELERRGITA